MIRFLILIYISYISLNADWKIQRENLDNVYILDEFRIFYTLKGKDALPEVNRVDLDKNKIPDYIENIAFRLQLTKLVLIDELGFKNPLKSNRYKDVKYIDIHILNDDSSSTGDGIHQFDYVSLDNKDFKSIVMKLKTNLSNNTLTPTHEYFHIIQNAYSMFKNRWYTEGTARWSEKVFEEGTGRRDALPSNIEELNILLNRTYDAKYFWRKITYECDTNNGKFPYKSWMSESIGNYPKLLEDNRIYGYEFMRVFLENLDLQDDIVSKKRGFEEFVWKESEQKDNKNNNKYILKALNDTIINKCDINKDEIKSFLSLINMYIKE